VDGKVLIGMVSTMSRELKRKSGSKENGSKPNSVIKRGTLRT